MKKISYRFIIGLLLIAAIVIIKIFFHHGVYLVDVLTGQPVNDITIKVSLWRVVFEPMLGPLMFYLRGHDPLNEFLILMVWVLGFIFIKEIIAAITATPGSWIRRAATAGLHWLAIIPVIVILWIALLTLLILAPLPTNTITKHRSDTALVNFHSHSYYSHDGLISQEQLVKWHHRNGFDAFFITDHNHHKHTLNFVNDYEADTLNTNRVCVLPGQEYSGSNHLLLLGLDHDFVTKGMADNVVVDTVHSQGGIVVVAHWFADQHQSLQYYLDCGVDGFEIANQGEGIDYDRNIFQKIVFTSLGSNLFMFGDADYHGYGNACYVWNALNIPFWDKFSYTQKKEAILSFLKYRKSHNVQVITYNDRRFLNQRLIWTSPVLNFIDYFRSLNNWQCVSWLVWILGVWLMNRLGIAKGCVAWLNDRRFRKFGLIGISSAVFVLIVGIKLWRMSMPLKGYNDILFENGIYFVAAGVLFIIYSIMLLCLPAGEKV